MYLLDDLSEASVGRRPCEWLIDRLDPVILHGAPPCTKLSSLALKPGQRKGMMVLIEDLQKGRGYKLETFYLAVSLADHYLATMAREEKPAPESIADPSGKSKSCNRLPSFFIQYLSILR